MTTAGNSQRARGFASMDAAKQREIASRGGRAAHAHGTAHKFSSDEARRAGRKGGEAVSGNREHMAAIGRRGGEARQARRAARAQSEAGAGGENANVRPAANDDSSTANDASETDEQRNDDHRH